MTVICGNCGGRNSRFSLGYIPRGNDRYTTFRQCFICEVVSSYNIEIPSNMGKLAGQDLSDTEPFCSVPFEGGPVLSFKTPPETQSSAPKARID